MEAAEQIDGSPFGLGTHLRVRRHGLHWHHGVYVGNHLVVEFGGRVSDKPRATVREVPLTDFEGGSIAKVVPHPSRFLFGLGMGLPEALSADEVIARARWMVKMCPERNYNLIGSNCEHFANRAVTGGYFEGLQVRRIFAVLRVISLGLLLCWRLSNDDRRWTRTLLGVSAVCFIGPLLYNTVPYLLWRDVLKKWPGMDIHYNHES
jgi:hypothetical protein